MPEQAPGQAPGQAPEQAGGQRGQAGEHGAGPDRSVLRLSGRDCRGFLQGLVTNDVRRLDAGTVYAALLTPQGKYLADFLLVAEGDDVLLDVAAPFADDLVRRLSLYRLRADVTIAPSDLRVIRGHGPAPAGALADPRHPSLGWRLYAPAAGPAPAPDHDAAEDGKSADAGWDAIRVEACIPESGVELVPGASFILECGFERLNGVDFRKGCYVGQEVTARMKHKTDLRKGLAVVTVDGAAPVGTEILSAGRPAGVLYTQAGGRGIAWLRFDRADGPLVAGTARLTLA
ncbi:MAG: YgfZ/GcvT domain-containing protein [Pseudomonadota bacterium]